MADGADLVFDSRGFAREMDVAVQSYERAGLTAVTTVTKRLERRLEDAIRGAVPGRLWRAWASKVYPNDRNPAGIIYVKGGDRARGAMTFWSSPGAIRGQSGQYLAVPLPAAGSRGRNRSLTPGEWERDHPGVRLQFVYRPGRASLLVAVGAVNGRTGTFRAGTASRVAKGRLASVPIFVLIAMVRFRNAVALEPLVRQAETELPAEFLRSVSGGG